MSNTEQKIAEEVWEQKIRARERIGTLREEKGDREFVAAHASKGAIPRKEIEALRWLISQRFVVPETDNVQFALVLSLLQRLSQLPTAATESEPTCKCVQQGYPDEWCPTHGKSDSASTGKYFEELAVLALTRQNPRFAMYRAQNHLFRQSDVEFWANEFRKMAATPSGGTASTGKCPFCGGEGVLLSTHDIPRNQYLWVQCNDCGGQGPRFKCYGEDALGRDKAWETWKRRVAEIPSGVGAKWTEIWNQANKVCALSGAVANDCDHHGITRPTWWKAVKKLQKLINSADAHNACLK